MVLSARTKTSLVAVGVAAAAITALTAPVQAAAPQHSTGAASAQADQQAAEQAVIAPVVAPLSTEAPYKGVVLAKTGLLVRNGPTTKAKIIGTLKYKQVVGIECKVNGQNVAGNPRWYKLSNGTYAWAAARYIANVGPVPRWC